MENQVQDSTKRIVDAEDIIGVLTTTDKVLYSLSDVTISGEFNLKYHVINAAIEIQNCEFLDEIDFRYCEFKSTVNLSNNCFNKTFNSGDNIESHTIFRKDLICNNAIFKSGANFNTLQCEGAGYFIKTRFEDADKDIDFSFSSFTKGLVFNESVFQGGANFSYLICQGPTSFDVSQFNNKEKTVGFMFSSFGKQLSFADVILHGGVSFESIECKGIAAFDKSKFNSTEKITDFRFATFEGQLSCVDVTFNGQVIFDNIRCKSDGILVRSKFDNPSKAVSFIYAKFEKTFDCTDVVFRGGVSFNSIECINNIFLNKANFENPTQEVNFVLATLKGNMYCIKSIFKGSATFNRLKCEGSGTFTNAKFENSDKEIDFIHASFGRDFNCTKVTFEGGASFNSMKCERDGMFSGTLFKNSSKEIDFKYAFFGRILDCTDVMFHDRVDFYSAHIGGSFFLRGQEICGRLSLNHVTMKQLILRNSPLSSFIKDKVDLRECSFESFYGTKAQWKQLVNIQAPDSFSRDPYLQFERYYQKIGDDSEAKMAYLEGRRALRAHAIKKGTGPWFRYWIMGYGAEEKRNMPIQWKRRKWLGDWMLDLLTGYGVQTWRLVIAIFLVIGAGTGIFWSDDALVLKPSGLSSGRILQTCADLRQKRFYRQEFTTVASNHDNPLYLGVPGSSPGIKEEQGCLSLGGKVFQRAGYSVELFMPVIKLGLTDQWQISTLGRKIYAFVHMLIGWLFIPLLIASISGIMRKY